MNTEMNGMREENGMEMQEMTAQALMEQEETALPAPDVDAPPEDDAQTEEHEEDTAEGGEEEEHGALPDAEQCRRELAQLALNGFTM